MPEWSPPIAIAACARISGRRTTSGSFTCRTTGDENWRSTTLIWPGKDADLTPFDGVQAWPAIDLTRDRILVGLNKDDQRLHDVYRSIWPEGGLTKVVLNPGMVAP
jgi:hypothetical protein